MSDRPVTDLSYLREIAMGDEEIVIETAETFLDNIPEIREKVRTYFANQEWDKLFKKAHKIKPNLQYMGMERARELIVEIEEQARTGNIEDGLGEKIEEFDELCSRAAGELSSKVEELKTD